MGRFMIPCCCICGEGANKWNTRKWKWQDFCFKCGDKIEKKYGKLIQYLWQERILNK